LSPSAAVFRVPRFRAGRPMYLLDAVFFLVRELLNLLWWAVLLAVIVQNLIAFNVLDTRNRFVWTVADFLYRVTEPLFRRVRGFMPNLGAIDLSPIIVLLLITATVYLVTAVQRYMILSGLYV
jgi:YggT family protein